jgi:hypothetical protein
VHAGITKVKMGLGWTAYGCMDADSGALAFKGDTLAGLVSFEEAKRKVSGPCLRVYVATGIIRPG